MKIQNANCPFGSKHGVLMKERIVLRSVAQEITELELKHVSGGEVDPGGGDDDGTGSGESGIGTGSGFGTGLTPTPGGQPTVFATTPDQANSGKSDVDVSIADLHG